MQVGPTKALARTFQGTLTRSCWRKSASSSTTVCAQCDCHFHCNTFFFSSSFRLFQFSNVNANVNVNANTNVNTCDYSVNPSHLSASQSVSQRLCCFERVYRTSLFLLCFCSVSALFRVTLPVKFEFLCFCFVLRRHFCIQRVFHAPSHPINFMSPGQTNLHPQLVTVH